MRDRETETKEFLCQVRVMTVCGEYGDKVDHRL
jgi:hypothetical protein